MREVVRGSTLAAGPRLREIGGGVDLGALTRGPVSTLTPGPMVEETEIFRR